ncbi:MAG: hypothetical protein ACI9DO_001859 [Reinekea sp.]
MVTFPSSSFEKPVNSVVATIDSYAILYRYSKV